MSVRMRHTRGHSGNRRSHHKVSTPRLSSCVKCGAEHLRHHLCDNCGTYREHEIIDVVKKDARKLERMKAKARTLGQEPSEVEVKKDK